MSNSTFVKPVTVYVVALYDCFECFLGYYTGNLFPLFYKNIAFVKPYKRKGFALRLVNSDKFKDFLINFDFSAKIIPIFL